MRGNHLEHSTSAPRDALTAADTPGHIGLQPRCSTRGHRTHRTPGHRPTARARLQHRRRGGPDRRSLAGAGSHDASATSGRRRGRRSRTRTADGGCRRRGRSNPSQPASQKRCSEAATCNPDATQLSITAPLAFGIARVPKARTPRATFRAANAVRARYLRLTLAPAPISFPDPSSVPGRQWREALGTKVSATYEFMLGGGLPYFSSETKMRIPRAAVERLLRERCRVGKSA
jgi:hypothetical protein